MGTAGGAPLRARLPMVTFHATCLLMTMLISSANGWIRRSAYLLAVMTIGLVLPAALPAQTEDEEELWERLQPGLLAEYTPLPSTGTTAAEKPSLPGGTAAKGLQAVRRIDDQLAFARVGRAPDARLSASRFRATWTGRLFTMVRGEYRLYVYAAPGRLRVSLLGQVLFDGDLAAEGWADCRPIELSYGYHPLEVHYAPSAPQSRIALYWSGPQFRLEPVAARYLFHDPPQENLRAFEQGQRLVHALRCAACHGPDSTVATHGATGFSHVPARPIPGPSLAHLAGNVHHDWLIQWLTTQGTAAQEGGDASRAAAPNSAAAETPDSAAPPARRMPHFQLSAEEAQAVAAFLTVRPAAPQAGTTAQQQPPRPSKPARGKQPPPPTAEAGRELFRSIGCLACHQAEGLGTAGLFGGGDLSAIAAKRPSSFFETWLRDPVRLNPDHRMPVFSLTANERANLALYLAGLGDSPAQEPTGNRQHGSHSDGTAAASDALVAKGRDLVRAHRCAACHALPEPSAGDRVRPPESLLAPIPSTSKTIGRDSDWSRSCIAPPHSGNGRGDQPRYALAPPQAAAVQAFYEQVASPSLQISPREARHVESGREASRQDQWQGRLVLEERNCLACHARDAAPGIEPSLDAVLAASPELGPLIAGMKPPALHGVGDKLHREALADAIALRHPPLRPWLAIRMPKFDLADDERETLVDHLIAVDRIPPRPAAQKEGHSVGDTADSGGNGNQLPSGGEGDGSAALAGAFDEQALLVAGGRLVTASGFGCTSCHQIGKAIPEKVELKSRGPDLSRLGRRIRRSWYDRWMPNPARIVPRMEMPSVVNPISGVLDGQVETQLHAVWHVLNLEEFNPPKPNPVRIVRRTNLPEAQERAVVLTDAFEVSERPYVKPLVIGLHNRHTVLFDLEQNRLAAWWMGDAARQHTRGKSWYWEPGGTVIMMPQTAQQGGDAAQETGQKTTEILGEVAASELLLVRGNVTVVPQLVGQFPTEFDWFEHVDGGIRFRHRLRFQLPDLSNPAVLTVTQEFRHWSAATGNDTGFRRYIEVSGVPRGWTVHLRGVPPQASLQVASARHAPHLANNTRIEGAQLTGLAGASYAEALGNQPWKISTDVPAGERGAVGVLAGAAGGERPAGANENAGVVHFDLVYGTPLPADYYSEQPVPLPVPPAAELNVAPGFKAVRLPLDPAIMPTGLAWRSDKSLVISSLKGRVWLARDTDGDGLEDELRPFSDDFAAPYGLRAAPDDTPSQGVVDVINKYALLRLIDRDGDGFAERTETIASGWGHTTDYHDWVVGLPRDSQGRYYLAIPCQQDDRSQAAAQYRGQALRLVPRTPDATNPLRYDLEALCGGLRFPMGLALSPTGDLFATDNQGNYNPFNELNHLQAGKRYGFINRLEFRPDFKPPLTPPAINIPHPWTRSVNGLCFLVAEGKNNAFGPFSGHLVGCEYDTQKLIRMSLEWVDGQYQGATYPFSVEAENPLQALQGPLVCEVAPDGALYVGNIRDSAWGGGANTGSIVRIEPSGPLPPGIAEVRALADGFTIEFTAPVQGDKAARPSSYRVSSYRRESTPAYGGSDLDRREHAVREVTLAPDRRSARIRLDAMRPGFVYELRLENLAEEGTFFPSEAHYSLNRVPKP